MSTTINLGKRMHSNQPYTYARILTRVSAEAKDDGSGWDGRDVPVHGDFAAEAGELLLCVSIFERVRGIAEYDAELLVVLPAGLDNPLQTISSTQHPYWSDICAPKARALLALEQIERSRKCLEKRRSNLASYVAASPRPTDAPTYEAEIVVIDRMLSA